MQLYLQNIPLKIHSLQSLPDFEIFPEDGQTYLDNARGKSLFYSKNWKGLTLGEDSGLEIDFLNGAPGVYSARFSDPGATDEKNIQKTLDLLKGVPREKRAARFVSCMVLSREGRVIREIQDSVSGFIAEHRRGESGFGYDPIFYYPPLQKTFAELGERQKTRVSHRGKALEQLRIFLESVLSG